MLKIRISIIICIAALSLAMYGGQPGSFMYYGSSARMMGMGRAYLGLADDSTAANINPAGMTQIKSMEGSIFSSSLYGAYNYHAINFVYPLINETFGFSLLSLSSAPMDLRNEYNESIGSFTDSNLAIGLSYARKVFLPDLSVGVTGKYLSRTLHDHADSRLLGDASVYYQPLPNISLAGTIQNVIGFDLSNNSNDKFTPILRGGIAYKDKNIKIAFDIENDFNNWFLGAEYRFDKMISLRGGINYESVNLGFGLNLDIARFDYAYSTDELGDNHRFSLNLGVGQIVTMLQYDASIDWFNKSVEKYQEGFFLYSLEDMKKAYILNPESQDIKTRLDRLQKLESMSGQLGLNLNTEKALWPKYQEAKNMIKDSKYPEAKSYINSLLQKFPNNVNLLKLQDSLKDIN